MNPLTQTFGGTTYKATPNANITPEQVATAKQSGWTEPTVLTNENKITDVIPNLIAKAANLTPKGTTTSNVKDTTDIYSEVSKALEGRSEFDISPEQKSLMDMMKQNIDAQTQSSLSALQSAMAQKEAGLVESQKASSKGLENVLNLGGSARYAPLSSQGLLDAKVKYDLNTLQELQAKEQSMKAEILQNQREGQYKLMEQNLGLLETKRKEKLTMAQKITESLLEQNKEVKKRQLESERDAEIGNMIVSGTTDPASIMKDLVSKGFDVTSSDISNAIKNLTVEGTDSSKINTDLGTFNYLKKTNSLPSEITSLPQGEQYISYLRMVKGIQSPTSSSPKVLSVGANASTPVEETMIRTRLFSKLMNIINKGQVSDSDRKIIDERIAQFRDAGYEEQEILDKLSGFSTNVTTPYNNSFRNLIVQNTDDSGKQSDLMGKVSLLLNSGDTQGALKLVENTAMTKAKQVDPDNYMGSATAETYLKKVQRVKQLFEQSGLGLISGNFQNLIGRLKGTEATKVKAELTSLYAQFRKENLGSAVTPSEAKFLEPLLASITDTSGNFNEKLSAFERSVIDRYNSTRNSVNLPIVNTNEVVDPTQKLSLYEDATPELDAEKKVRLVYETNPELSTKIDDAIRAYYKKYGSRPSYIDLLQSFPEIQ